MADDDEGGGHAGSEQPTAAGGAALLADVKDLERASEPQLEVMHRRAVHERFRIHRQLNEQNNETDRMRDLLSLTSDRLRKATSELDALRSRQKTRLPADTEGRINRMSEDIVNRFIALRARQDMNEMFVDVRYLPGVESTGFHIGGEGAGSLLARFRVQLDSQVSDLAYQAAKYWGLDDEKVFFLDREHRILPDSMHLEEIILPRGVSSSTSSTAGTMALANQERGDLQHALIPVLQGRNYLLTMLRAGTILDKEDLSRAKGGPWNDFTFEQAKLEKELENTRKRFGEFSEVATKVDMDDIPSLYVIQQRGLDRMKRRRWDTWCRIFEAILFFLCHATFLIAVRPVMNAGTGGSSLLLTRKVAQAVQDQYLQIQQFEAIRTPAEYTEYLGGPLERALVSPGMDASNLYVLGAIGYLYEGQPSMALDSACEIESDAGDSGNSSNASNSSTGNESSNSSSSSGLSEQGGEAIATNDTNTTNATNGTNVTDDAADTASARVCPPPVPPELQGCLNERARSTLRQGLAHGHQIPACDWQFSENAPVSVFGTVTSFPSFDYMSGEVATYVGGIVQRIETNNTTAYADSMSKFMEHDDEHGRAHYPAKMLAIFVYSPVIYTLCIMQLLVETTLSGTLITSVQPTFLRLSDHDNLPYAMFATSTLLSLLVLVMELRRIFGCPKRFYYEKDVDMWSTSTLLHILLPILLTCSHGLEIAQNAFLGGAVIELGDDGQLSADSVHKFYRLYQRHFASEVMDLATALLLQFLSFRYLIAFFPTFKPHQNMIKASARPLFGVLFLMLATSVILGLMLYTGFGSRSWGFHTLASTNLQVMKMLMGGSLDWQHLFKASPVGWTVIALCFFVLVVLVLRNVVLAILLSHKKHLELTENYSYSLLWSIAKGRLTSTTPDPRIGDKIRVRDADHRPWREGVVRDIDPLLVRARGWCNRARPWPQTQSFKQDINPATVGWDFDDPREPTDPNAWVKVGRGGLR